MNHRCFLPNLSKPHRLRHLAQCCTRAMVLSAGLLVWPAAQAAGVQVAELRAMLPSGWPGAAEAPATQSPWTSRLGLQETPVSAGSSLYWLGDYRFAPSWGLRATGGLLGRLESNAPSGQPAAAFRLERTAAPADGLRATPYLGFGYDRPPIAGGGWGGWGLSADVGLVSRSWTAGSVMTADPRSVRLGNSSTGDDWLRSLRLMPLVQVGVSYAF